MDDSEREEIEARLKGQIAAYHEAAMLFTAVQSGLPDVLKAKGPLGPEALAAELGLQPDPLRRFLRGLVTIRLCEELADGRFGLTPVGRELATGGASSLREKAEVVVGQYWTPWSSLILSLKTGAPAFAHVYGAAVSDWRAEHPEQGAAFYGYLAKEEIAHGDESLAMLPHLGTGKIASIGSGYGAFLIPLLRAVPELRAIVFEAPETVAEAVELFDSHALAPRVSFVGGDMRGPIPVAADVYVLKSVLQQHDDDDAGTILRNCREAMQPGARLIVWERLRPERAADDPAAVMLDLHMMAISGGRARTKPEMQSLITDAGLTVAEDMRTLEGLTLIVCKLP